MKTVIHLERELTSLHYLLTIHRFIPIRFILSTLSRTHIHLVNIKINLYLALVIIPIGVYVHDGGIKVLCAKPFFVTRIL